MFQQKKFREEIHIPSRNLGKVDRDLPRRRVDVVRDSELGVLVPQELEVKVLRVVLVHRPSDGGAFSGLEMTWVVDVQPSHQRQQGEGRDDERPVITSESTR